VHWLLGFGLCAPSQQPGEQVPRRRSQNSRRNERCKGKPTSRASASSMHLERFCLCGSVDVISSRSCSQKVSKLT
jgi:hypothetical protein